MKLKDTTEKFLEREEMWREGRKNFFYRINNDSSPSTNRWEAVVNKEATQQSTEGPGKSLQNTSIYLATLSTQKKNQHIFRHCLGKKKKSISKIEVIIVNLFTHTNDKKVTHYVIYFEV